MNGALKRLWSVGWRLAVAGILMTWAFHAIFHDQVRELLASRGEDLDALARTQRWITVWKLGPAEFAATLWKVRPGWLLVSVLLWGITIVLGGWRWLLVLRSQGLDPGWRRTLEISFVAHFFNSFLLGSTGGDLLKAYYAARVTRHLKTEAVASVLIDRVVGLFAMLGFAVAAIVPNLDLVLRHHRTLALGLVVLGMFSAASAALFLSLRGGVSRVFPKARDRLRRLPKAETLERGLEACRALGRRPVLFWQSVGISVLLTLVCILQLQTLVWGYGLDAPLMPVSWIVPSVICISALPVTPSGLGVRDYLYLYLLNLPEVGIPAGTAIAISLVAYAASLVWSALGGLFYVLMRSDHDLSDAMADR